MKFTIDPESFGVAASGFGSNIDQADHASQNASHTTIGPGYSPASGYHELGVIHGKSLNTTPGSASAVMQRVTDELSALAENLIITRNAYQEQDSIFARVLHRADIGEAGSAALGALAHGGLGHIPGMYRKEVVVVPAASLDELIADLTATDAGAVHSATSTWADLAVAAENASEGLIDISNYLGAANYGDTVDAIINRLQRTGVAARTIGSNAHHFEDTLSQLEPARIANLTTLEQLKAELTALAATGGEGAAIAAATERVLLAHNAVTTQATLAGITPRVIRLTDPVLAAAASPITTLTAADGGIGFDGTRFVAPQAMVDTLRDFAYANPDQAGRINALTQEMSRHSGNLEHPGILHPASIGTAPSTAGTLTPPSELSPRPLAAAPSPAAPTVASPSLSMPAWNGAAQASRDSGMPVAHSRQGQPLSATARYLMGTGYSELMAVPDSTPIGHDRAQRRGGASSQLRGGDSGAHTNGRLQRGSSPGFGSQPSPGRESMNAAPGAGGRGGASPMMAGGFGGAGRREGRKNKPPKIMITEVERDANRLALLGEPRKVLPGVIGEWIYEDPDDPNGTYPNKI
ncbi:hypothetical protein [Corynebacterium uterequi]|uniref:PPE family protein n=1 Tax=Corynebacterium uterequi TaxID=1072256 RepID=A0A0G3HJU9_9CORY|nr:hypothetical protein [Corynebacterium uterequi]AKK11397.1 hypothetical protein CUTER_07040 [Corynebacterium uterequi]